MVLVLLAVAIVGTGFAVMELLIRRSYVGLVLALGTVLIHALLDQSPQVILAGFTVTAYDVVFGLLFAAGLARLLRQGRLAVPQLLLLVFTAVALFSVGRGVGVFGIEDAVNQFRKHFEFLSAALYFSTLDPRRPLLDRLGRAWLVACLLLMGLAVVRWVAFAAGLSGGVFGSSGTMRVLDSGFTFVLLQGFFISLSLWRSTSPPGNYPPWMRNLAPALLAFLVLLQHRTVWVSLVAGLAVMVMRDQRLARRTAAIGAAALATIAVLGLTVLGQTEADVGQQLERSATEYGTLEWRYQGWVALLTDNRADSPVEVLAGKPFGHDFDRRFGGRLVDSSPHSYYIEPYLRVGLIGLMALLTIYAFCLRWLRTRDRQGGLLTNEVLFVLLVTHLVFYITYAAQPTHGVLLGIGIAAARYKHREARLTAEARPVEAPTSSFRA